MRKEFILGFALVLVVLVASQVSATITLDQQPNQVYNLGDTINIPLKIVADSPINDVLSVKLDCGTTETEIYKEYISMTTGEKKRDLTIPVKTSFLGNSTGSCKLNYQLGSETGSLTGAFSISNKIIISANPSEDLFSPGDTITISGTANKENGESVNGVIEANLSGNSSANTIYSNIISDGKFDLQINLPKNIAAGSLTVNLKVYEKNPEGVITNKGSGITSISIKQVPTNLEIVLDESSLNPGETLRGKIVLHDQSGASMGAEGYVSIKNEDEEIISKSSVNAEDYFEYPINESQVPVTWKITAYVGDLTTTLDFNINEYNAITSDIVGNVLTVTNVGNVPYTNPVEIKIGNESREVELNLDLGETQKFTITAPDGEYLVQIGDETQTATLTGKAVDVKEFSNRVFSINPIIWVFVILILGFVVFMIFKKGYKKTFFGRKFRSPGTSNKVPGAKGDEMLAVNIAPREPPKKKGALINPAFPAELSISLHGTKQQSDIISINLKNHPELKSGEGGVKETLQNIVNFASERKALTYFTKDNLFFLLVPTKTKTFKNEMKALEIAKEAERLLKHHNKMFKQKIDFGIAIDSGDLVVKDSKGGTAQFMAMTPIMTNLKKISHYSNQEVYFSDVLRGRLGSSVKTERIEGTGSKVFHKLKMIVQKADNSKFVKGFMDRLEKDKERMKQIKKDSSKTMETNKASTEKPQEEW